MGRISACYQRLLHMEILGLTIRTCSLRLLRLKTEESGGELSLAALVAAREGYAEILRSTSVLYLALTKASYPPSTFQKCNFPLSYVNPRRQFFANILPYFAFTFFLLIFLLSFLFHPFSFFDIFPLLFPQLSQISSTDILFSLKYLACDFSLGTMQRILHKLVTKSKKGKLSGLND